MVFLEKPSIDLRGDIHSVTGLEILAYKLVHLDMVMSSRKSVSLMQQFKWIHD